MMNSRWNYQTIGDVCTVERGGSPRPIDDYITESSDGINWIKIGDTDDSMFITKTAQKIRPEGMKKSRYVQPGDFLLSNSMSFGRPYILKIDGCIHDGWLVLRDNKNLFDKRFLYYYLSSKTTYQRFKAMAVGGVVNNLNSEMVRKVSVPIPSLREQSEVADLLDSVNSIIQERNRELTLLDDLIKARFVEMFGDPINNTKNLPVRHLGDLGIWNSGGTPSRSNPEYFCGSINWYSAGELNSLYLHGSNEKITEEAVESSAAKLFKSGSMLVGMYDTAAFKMGILTEDSASNQACACIEPNSSIDIVWLYYALTLMKDTYLSQRRGVRQKNLNLGMIRDFTLPTAYIDEQKQFVGFVEQVDKSKVAVQKSLDETQLLFDCLMQNYFG